MKNTAVLGRAPRFPSSISGRRRNSYVKERQRKNRHRVTVSELAREGRIRGRVPACPMSVVGGPRGAVRPRPQCETPARDPRSEHSAAPGSAPGSARAAPVAPGCGMYSTRFIGTPFAQCWLLCSFGFLGRLVTQNDASRAALDSCRRGLWMEALSARGGKFHASSFHSRFSFLAVLRK